MLSHVWACLRRTLRGRCNSLAFSYLFPLSGSFNKTWQNKTPVAHLREAVKPLNAETFNIRRGFSGKSGKFSRVIVDDFPAVKLPPWWAEAVIWRFTAIFVLPPPPESLPPKNEKPTTAEKLPPYGITAEKLPPHFGFTASAEVVTAKKRKTAYRQKLPPYGITAPKVPPTVIPPTKTPLCRSGQKGWLCAF